ncbi:hypothetical protein ACH4TV_16485 [Streptomyces sp. NPDC020898]|uniref:hypothetical protein n=1 Tax=Streptomyces sp. NPDC020898 TaxID=3365101 RepID=UPI00379B6320
MEKTKNTQKTGNSDNATGMKEAFVRRLTGAAGIAAAVALIVEVPLYFIYSGPPPDANVLARLLIGIFALAFLIVFVTFSAVNGRVRALGRSHLVALPTAPYDGTVTGRISPRSGLFRPVRGRVR